MKVLHVIPSLSPARGGPAFALRQTVAALNTRGITVHVAATDDDGPGTRLNVRHGSGIADSGGLAFYFPRQTEFYTFSWPLTAWLRQHIRDYDLVHIHALFSYPSVAAAHIAHAAGVPYLLRPLGTLASWGLQSRRPLLKRCSIALLEARMMRGAAAVQATSEQERDEVLSVCPECRAVVVPNPVETPVDQPVRPLREQPRNILFLSRIDPKKGLELLLRAFDRVATDKPNLRLVIAGGGAPDYVESIRSLAASLSHRDRVQFTGNVDGDLKRRLFEDADLFALPSYSENFGVAVVEAMAHGVPVLISRYVGICNEVEAAGAGRTAECDPARLADAIRAMLANPLDLARMGENARKLAAERYAPDVVARQLIAEYEHAITARAARGGSLV